MSNKTLNTILYAEDESDIREIAQIALEDLGGFEVIYCTNGFEVLKAAKETAPDLLLLDVMMPGMDGPTALSELRKMPGYVQIPAIFMTAKIQSEEIQHYMAMGALEVISKPFDPMTLANKIKSAWERQA
ncbi:response regulator [Legionella sp. MW5194]|uniref:response regulator n=1 Tax=Legionella sp. MW5194 TaxID=2662448 RepID=UPI00193E05AE|nr:response regulator [Legionella sp. MW5194]QRN03025.1 response regulator [Legionella sp. MW5194]